MKLFLIFSIFSLLTGCSAFPRKLTVISTPSTADVRRININDGDLLLCDKEVCRIVKP